MYALRRISKRLTTPRCCPHFAARASFRPRRIAFAACKSIRPACPGAVVLEPRVFPDERGFFTETYRREWHAAAGIPAAELFVQDNHSRSTRGVVRGMHFHIGDGVAKLVRCARGRIVDVIVDLRRGSPTYAQWEARRARRREHARALRPGRLRARLLRAQRRRRRALQADAPTTTPPSSAGSRGTTPRSRSRGPRRSSRSSPRATPRRRPCASSPTSCRSSTSRASRAGGSSVPAVPSARPAAGDPRTERPARAEAGKLHDRARNRPPQPARAHQRLHRHAAPVRATSRTSRWARSR